MVRFLCGTPRGVPLLLYGLMSYEILHASAQDCSGGPGPTAQADAENAVMNNDVICCFIINSIPSSFIFLNF